MRRFVHPITRSNTQGSSTSNEVVNFEDYDNLVSVALVGDDSMALDIELRTHDGKNTIIDSAPAPYYKLGSGREEVELNLPISNNGVRVLISFEGGEDIKAALVFTLSK